MSPTYTSPAIQTIHQGEQLLTADGGLHDEYVSQHLDAPRERNRPSSSRSDTFGRKHRSGSPQVHPYLKASPVAEDDARGTTKSLAVPQIGLRRHASADFSLLKDASTGVFEGYRLRGEASGAKEVREQKRVRLSPSPRRPRASRSSSYHHEQDLQSGRFGGSGSLAKEPRTAVTEAADHGLSMGTPAEALRFLEGGAGSESAHHALTSGRHSSWAGHDEGMLSPAQRSSSPASSHSSGPHSVASSQTTADTELDGEDHLPGSNPGNIDRQSSTSHQGHSHSSSSSSRRRRRSADPDRYGTPEMPRGSAKLPHIPTNDLTPRVPTQGHNHPKHLPRAEKLPLSGYELLASTISSSSSSAVPTASRSRMSAFLDTPSTARGNVSRRHSSASPSFLQQSSLMGPPPPVQDEDGLVIKPIYRRFEALNHRLLLNLQDELSELEEQLHRLDTTDTQTRRLQSSILPASRRAEFLAGGELQWHKTDILNKIAFKLGQYNHTLSSFTSTRDLPAPTLSAVIEYRDYLATHQPITDVETRFLDSTDDLITLEAPTNNNSSRTTSTTNLNAPFASSSASSSSSSTLADSSEDVLPHRRTTSSDYLHSLRLPPDEPIVKPIPGTMHGNSWLVRHNRLSRGSRCSSTASTTTPSPRFSRPSSGAGLDDASPRLPPPRSSSQHSRVVVAEDKAKDVRGASEQPPRHMMVHLALSVAVAVLVPILTFSIVPGFIARMIVVLLVGLWVAGLVAQSVDGKRVMREARVDLMYSGAVYAGVMGVVAGVMA